MLSDAAGCCCSYGSEEFWEERYADFCDTFEWYCGYEDIRREVKTVKDGGTVLVAGCGSSRLAASMQEDGYDVVGVDISRIVVEEMKRRYPTLALRQGDLTKKNFVKGDSFDCVLDKGLLDSLEGSATPSESVLNYLEEVERMLKDDGVYFCVSVASPKERIGTLHPDHHVANHRSFFAWDLQYVFAIKKQPQQQQRCYLYVCKKSRRLVRLKTRRRRGR